VIEAADNLKRAADDSRALSRTVRVGRHRGDLPLLAPTIPLPGHTAPPGEILTPQTRSPRAAGGSMDLASSTT